MKNGFSFLAAVLLASVPAVAAEAVPQLLGKTYELASGDDPVETFAASGLSVTGASYVFSARDGQRFRADRAAGGRKGYVIVSRATRDTRANRSEWQVTSVIEAAVDTDDAFSADCKTASAGEVAFIYYEPDKGGGAIKKVEAAFRVDAKTGKAEVARLTPTECKPAK